jgi:hypothetical protein
MAHFPADSALTKHGFADEEIAQTQCTQNSRRLLALRHNLSVDLPHLGKAVRLSRPSG